MVVLLNPFPFKIALALAVLNSTTFAWSDLPTSSICRHRLNEIISIFSIKAADDDEEEESTSNHSGYNVLGTELKRCCSNVGSTGIGTGFYRNGFCSTGQMDLGRHTVCCRVTSDFLTFSKSVGNDLSTPLPEYNFPGLKDGDLWCLCAQRWVQAYNAGKAPQLFLQATHQKTLDYAPLDVLRIFAIDGGEANAVIGELDDQRNRLEKMMDIDTSEDSSFQ